MQALQSRRGKGVVSLPPSTNFFVDVRFFWRALEVPILKEVTKNVHENHSTRVT